MKWMEYYVVLLPNSFVTYNAPIIIEQYFLSAVWFMTNKKIIYIDSNIGLR